MSNEEHRITRASLPTEVEQALAECRMLLEGARVASNGQLLRDLDTAISALQLIDEEIRGLRPQRAPGQRSAGFIRYAIDEGDRMELDSAIRDRIVAIEDLYARMGREGHKATPKA